MLHRSRADLVGSRAIAIGLAKTALGVARGVVEFLLRGSAVLGEGREASLGMSEDHLTDLKLASAGDLDALHRVMPLIYDRARQIAEGILTRDGARKWVRASSLVNRAYVKLAEAEKVDLADEARLMATLATIMRHIVIDIVRREKAQKRGGGMQRVSLHDADVADDAAPVDALDIEDALVALAAVSPEAARVAELRLWGGLTLEQIGMALDLSFSQVRNRWNGAKAWLARELASSAERSGERASQKASEERG